VRIRLLLYAATLFGCAAPAHAALGSAPQCFPPEPEIAPESSHAKLPLPPTTLSFRGLSYTLEDRDYLIRTIAFEAGDEPDEGKAAVAHVVLNRTMIGRWGDTIKEVVTSPWQFEPWMMKRKAMLRLSKYDPLYQTAARIADAVLDGMMPDPTAGATHFLNPTIVRKRRGGSLPSWASGEGQQIGRHTFYALAETDTSVRTTLAVEAFEDSTACPHLEAGEPRPVG
jgi:N-acetylmuramoyl-L-alanine amidase